jgi:hypothetical protein
MTDLTLRHSPHRRVPAGRDNNRRGRGGADRFCCNARRDREEALVTRPDDLRSAAQARDPEPPGDGIPRLITVQADHPGTAVVAIEFRYGGASSGRWLMSRETALRLSNDIQLMLRKAG